jgi:hypothetical protein
MRFDMRHQLLALVLIAAAAHGQTASLSGRVRVAGDTAVVPYATITVDAQPDTHLADSTGSFRIGGLSSGRHMLTVRRLGFQPATVPSQTGSDVDVRLKALPKLLQEVVISGEVVSVPFRFEEVYRRAASGFGHFITREEIERRNPYATRDLLNGIPGIVTYGDATVFQKCRKRQRGGPPNFESANKVQVYIDGRRFTRFSDGETAADAAMASVSPGSIQAMEVYTGVAQVPGEFAYDACAVILIWTKRY